MIGSSLRESMRHAIKPWRRFKRMILIVWTVFFLVLGSHWRSTGKMVTSIDADLKDIVTTSSSNLGCGSWFPTFFGIWSPLLLMVVSKWITSTTGLTGAGAMPSFLRSYRSLQLAILSTGTSCPSLGSKFLTPWTWLWPSASGSFLLPWSSWWSSIIRAQPGTPMHTLCYSIWPFSTALLWSWHGPTSITRTSRSWLLTGNSWHSTVSSTCSPTTSVSLT